MTGANAHVDMIGNVNSEEILTTDGWLEMISVAFCVAVFNPFPPKKEQMEHKL